MIKLRDVAHARSGDKGDRCNIGVIARRPEHYAILVREVTADRVAAWFGPWCKGSVERFELPNVCALNFVLRGALDGGALRTLRMGRQGKTYAEALLELPLDGAARSAPVHEP